MDFYIKISSTLREYVPNYEPAKGLWFSHNIESATAESLAQLIGLPLDEIKFVMINGRQLPLNTILHNGDRVAFFPAVGGG